MKLKQLAYTPTLRRLAAACLLLQMAIAYPLWLGWERTFPMYGIWAVAYDPATHKIFHSFFGGLVLAALIGLIARPQRKVTVATLGILTIGAALDLTRLQVWHWQWSMVLLLTLITQREAHLRTALRLMIVLIYTWSGLHKLNVHYFDFVWPYLTRELPSLQLPALAYGTAVAEILVGLLLIWPRTRRAGVWAATALHVSIIAALSPLWLSWNYVVLPWNAAMIAFVWLTCYPQVQPTASPWHRVTANRVVILAFGLLPALNYVGYCPESLALKMYAGTNPDATLYVNSDEIECLPDMPEKFFGGTGYPRLIVDDWALGELNVPAFATLAAYKAYGRYLCNCTAARDAGVDILYVHPFDKEAGKWTNYDCRSLSE